MTYRRIAQGALSPRTGTATAALPSATPAANLAEHKERAIARLWEACSAYERRFLSGGAHALIFDLRRSGNPKAVRVYQWIMSLWREYYRRRDHIEAARMVDEIVRESLIFDVCGAPPHSLRELLTDAPAA